MKKLLILTITLLASLTVTAQIPTDKHLIKYLEINTTKSDYGLTFLDDDKVVFAMPIDEESKGRQSDLYVGDVKDKGEISNKELIKGMRQVKKVSKTGVTYSKDLKTVFFSAKKDKRKKIKEKDQLFRANIDAAGNWINIEKLPFNSDRYSTGQPTLSHDGKKLYFVSDGLGSYGGSKDIYVVDVNDDGTYGQPQNLGDKINTKGDEITPYITEGNMLYFSSNGRSNSKGSLDIYASEVFNSTVSESFHLEAPINSTNDDFAYILNKDNNAGYFSSNRLQGQDNNDIYSFIIEKSVPEKCLQEIAGIVKDKKTDEVINDAAMTLFDNEGNQIQQIVTDANGAYQFVLDCNQTYTLVASSLYYIKDEHIVNTANYINAPALEANKLLIKKTGAELEEALAAARGEETPAEDIAVTKEEDTKAVEETTITDSEAPVSPVYFGFDKSNITEDATVELDKIAAILDENTSLKIEVSAHTDSRGSSAYNLNLSNRRAKSTVDYLVSKGINKNRIIAKGYGESRMINKCVNGVECSEEAHAKNRRTDFVILNSQTYHTPEKRVPSKEEDTTSLVEAKKKTIDDGDREISVVENSNTYKTEAIVENEDVTNQKNYENNLENLVTNSDNKTNHLKTDNIKSELSISDRNTADNNKEETIAEIMKESSVSDDSIAEVNLKDTIEESKETNSTSNSNVIAIIKDDNQSKSDLDKLIVETDQKDASLEKSKDSNITASSNDQTLAMDIIKLDSKNLENDENSTGTDVTIERALVKDKTDVPAYYAENDQGLKNDLISETNNDQVIAVAVQPLKKKALQRIIL